MRLFTSFADEDGTFVEKLNNVLRTAGHHVNVTPPMGSSCGADRMQILDAADWLIIVWSGDALNTPNARTEWEYKLAVKNRNLIVVLRNDTSPPDSLSQMHQIEGRSKDGITVGEEILRAIDQLSLLEP